MAKPRAKRGRGKKGRRPLIPPAVQSAPAAPPPARPAPLPVAVATSGAPERAREPSVTRFSVRDYTYVRRDLQRIILLAGAIIIAIVVLSFFLP